MVAQHWRKDSEISHESPHALLVFKLSKQIKKLERHVINFPSTEAGLNSLGEEFAKYIDIGVGSKIDILYSAIFNASRQLNLVKTHHG